MEKDWVYYKGHCYSLSKDLKSWTDARADCFSKGGDLASVLSVEENSFLADKLNKSKLQALIGYRKIYRNHYVWYDGNPKGYEAWDDTKKKVEADLVMCGSMTSGNGRWNENICTYQLNYICKKVDDNKVSTKLLPNCPLDWIQMNDLCYKVSTKDDTSIGKKSWYEASDTCSSTGTNLPIIKDDITHRAAFDILKAARWSNMWLGLHSSNLEKVFVWNDGSLLNFSKWDDGEPNRLSLANDCVEISSSGQWNDNNCNVLRPYVCSLMRGKQPVQPTAPNIF